MEGFWACGVEDRFSHEISGLWSSFVLSQSVNEMRVTKSSSWKIYFFLVPISVRFQCQEFRKKIFGIRTKIS